jgi:2,4-didehydro-3-deoxy-L-rhamnonate hydrolase
MTLYSLCVVTRNGRPTPAIEIAGKFYDLRVVGTSLIKNPEYGLLDILTGWERAEHQLSAIATRLATPGDHDGLLPAPEMTDYRKLVTEPSKLIFAGLNYNDHLRDDLKIFDFDKSAVDPLFFLKHCGAHVAPGQSIPFPRQTKQLDWEVELVVIFGKAGRHISRADAMGHIAGYAIGLDLSARDWQMSERHMRKFDLFGGKAFDDSSPVGPRFVPARFIDPSNLDMKLWVNGELKQNSNSKEMIWSIAELIEAISQHMAIEPGDMLFSGSPAGVGLVKNTYLNPGDVIDAEIVGLGHLTTPILPLAG